MIDRDQFAVLPRLVRNWFFVLIGALIPLMPKGFEGKVKGNASPSQVGLPEMMHTQTNFV